MKKKTVKKVTKKKIAKKKVTKKKEVKKKRKVIKQGPRVKNCKICKTELTLEESDCFGLDIYVERCPKCGLVYLSLR